MSRAFVIYVPIPESEKAAARCISSGKKFDLRIELFRGFTPAEYPEQIAEDLGIPLHNFHEKYSRYLNCLSAFLSHRRLWEWCAHNKEEVLIFEHDAVVVQTRSLMCLIVVFCLTDILLMASGSRPPTLGVNKLDIEAVSCLVHTPIV